MFFFFKQKTAYEMLISDWSSDVCSSDLVAWRSMTETAASATVAPASTSATGGRGIWVAMSSTPRPARTARAGTGRMRVSEERSEERRVGTEWVRTCRSRWSPSHEQKYENI